MAKQNSGNNLKNYVTCKRQNCGKMFKTAAGRSKHHKKCQHDVMEKLYIELNSGRVQCRECDTLLSAVSNWFRHRKICINNCKNNNN